MRKKIGLLEEVYTRKIHLDKCFPMILMLDYNSVLYPRLKILLELEKPVDLVKALCCTNAEFCTLTRLSLEDLARVRPRKQFDEYEYPDISKGYATLLKPYTRLGPGKWTDAT